jgi:predicted dehydrogenase
MSSQETRRLTVAQVGAGRWGQVHLHAYRQHPQVVLKCVCEVNAEAAKAVESAFGVRTCGDYRRIAEDPEIQAVSVVTPDALHREIVTAMLDAGKHVLVEKPMATNLQDARAMAAAAERAGRHLMVDFHNRWNPPFVEAKRRIDAGEFGEPVMAHAYIANTLAVPSHRVAWAKDSGPHWFLLPHSVDVITWLLGRRAVRVTAKARYGVLTGMGLNIPDAVQALVDYGDCSALFETAWIIPDSLPRRADFHAMIQGTRSRMAIEPMAPLLTVAGQGGYELPLPGTFGEVHGVMAGWQLMPVTHFADCLLAGRAPMCTAADGLHNTAILCAILQSAETGETVAVAEC